MTDFGSLPNLRCLMTNDDNLIEGNEMHLLACSVYHSLLKHLPALVRLYNWEKIILNSHFNLNLVIHFDPVDNLIV